MRIRNNFWRFIKQKVRSVLADIFDNPVGRPAKKLIITLAGGLVVLIGILLIVLPGPASLLIPIGLAILSLEYPIARKWLRKFQRILSISAKKADEFVARFRRSRKA